MAFSSVQFLFVFLPLVLLFLGLMRVTAGTYSAFIYFQF